MLPAPRGRGPVGEHHGAQRWWASSSSTRGVFIFGRRGEPDFSVYIGSADLMERNLDRRVEVLVPIEDRTLQQDELLEAFEITWRDDLFTWVLGTDRRWRRLQPVNNFSAQERVQASGERWSRARSLATR